MITKMSESSSKNSWSEVICQQADADGKGTVEAFCAVNQNGD